MRPLPDPAPVALRYPLADSAVSRPAATACSDSPRWTLSQLAWLGSTVALLAVFGCGNDGSKGGLDPAVPGSLVVTVSGLPAGADAAMTLTGPGNYSRRIAGSETITGLPPGSYTLTAAEAEADGDGYLGTPATQSVLVRQGPASASATVSYGLSTARLTVAVTGVPDGAAAVQIIGPGGYNQAVTGSQTLKKLAPGNYAVSAGLAVVDGDRYSAPGAAQVIPVAVGATPSPRAPVDYLLVSGRLQITITGAPADATPAVTVSGPNGFGRALTVSQLLTGLDPGSYLIAAGPLSSSGHTYQPTFAPGPAVAVVASPVAAAASVSYAIATGGLVITIGGLPTGVAGSVVVTGPGGYSHPVSATETILGLAPGLYTIAASPVAVGATTYTPGAGSQAVSVVASTTPSQAAVQYAVGFGNLSLTVTGLPSGVSAALTVTGPNGFAQNVTSSQTLSGLSPGGYTVAAVAVSFGGQTYTPSPANQSKTVNVGTTVTASVAYLGPTGSLAVTVSGLPGGVSANLTVTGPGGYTKAVTGSATLTGLSTGSYTITAGNVVSGASTYGPTPSTQGVTVSGGATAAATVTYAVLSGATLNLQIDGMYLTQAAATYDGTTPVITGRSGYLRVFVKANQSNTAAPTVRVRFYSGATLVQTSTINPPGGTVPTAVTEGTFSSSWNVLVSGALVQPNLKILAEVDPTNLIAESDEGDNSFPSSGAPLAIDVRTVPTWNVRFVPILQQINGLQGNVTAANQAQFLADPLTLLPVAGYSADIRAAYTTAAPALEANNGNGAWGTILGELLALRSVEAGPSYYYGVAKTSYGSGVAGVGYVGGGVGVAMGWDALPSGSGIMAHEVGHNMGRSHSPCGGASSPDPAYPYPGGLIGSYGLDVATQSVKAPSSYYDFMGYCNPDWVSDYTWKQMISYRQSNSSFGPPAAPSSTAVAGLLVWGRVTAAGVVLEPAFRVAPPAAAPAGAGRFRVDGLAADGSALFSYPIEPVHTMTAGVQTDHEEHFAAVIPLGPGDEAALVRVRLVTPGGVVERLSLQASRQPGRQLFLRDPAASTAKPNGVQATFRWDGASYPMALIRDRATGEILSFARDGTATIWATGRGFEVTFSDGVQSIDRRLP